MMMINMNNFMLACIILLLGVACKSDSAGDDARSAPVQNAPAVQQPTPAPATPVTKPAEPAQNADGVWHFACSKNCGGGAGAAGSCPNCGSPLEHNSAYHATANTPAVTPQISGDGVTSPPIQVSPPTSPEPAQNAKGVWHFTCSNGCAGGGGSAIACLGCGSTLVHNTAYHN
ncbi:MAG: hypothetical protein AAGK97_09530 [Bacteroidota bacterium]